MNYKEKLKEISTFIFDVDGVLTNSEIILLPPNHMIRTMHTRDGYALQLAVKKGYNVCIITGGSCEQVKTRLNYLGIENVFLKSANKVEVYQSYLKDNNIKSENCLYMGDDIPDYEVMNMVGLPCCPSDAAPEIKGVSKYISPTKGGQGCVRDIIEQTLKVQNKWFDRDGHIW